MTTIDPHWFEHQRKRWMRPDAARWLQPNRQLWFRPGVLDRKYDPDQPRVPAGNPDGGRWTSGGSSGADRIRTGDRNEFGASRRPRLGSKPDGHHFVSHAVYSKLPFREETRKVFDEAKTGRLYGQRHGQSKEHDTYSDAVREHMDRFMAENGVSPESMTPDQARSFVDQIKRSRDPRIREFNMKIYRREMLYWFRRMPGRE
jgi:hypothetical protein